MLEQLLRVKSFCTLGFGAKIKNYKNMMKCFAINGNIFNPMIHGTLRIVNAYKNCLDNIIMSGDTFFKPIVKYVNDMAEYDMSNK